LFSNNAEKARHHNIGEGGAPLTVEVELSNAVKGLEQAGETDVALVVTA
jgi:hypothetical protein